MEELLELIDQKKYKAAREMMEEIQPVDLAEFMSDELDLEDKRIPILFRIMPKEYAADVFSYLDHDIQMRVAQEFNDKELKGLLDELFMDDTVDFLEEMPASMVRRVLKVADSDTRKHINQLLMYPDDSAGSLMTTELMEVHREWTVADAIKRVRRQCEDVETITNLYVTDKAHHLIGTISLKDLLTASDTETVADIAETNVISVSTLTDQEDIADMFKRYDFVSMPVVDAENRLLGVITIDDVVDVIEEETTEDIYRMAAMEPIETSYADVSVFTLAKKRIAWLSILMISATFTGLIIQRFEAALAANVILVSFIPMLMDTSGNAGSQASTSIIRALVLNEIEFKDLIRVIWKEFRVSLLVGSGVAVLNFLRILIFNHDLKVATVVSLTLLCAVIVANFVGCVLPICAQKLKLDPALMASPMITTIVDAVSLTLYFTIASIAFGIAM